MDRTDRFESFEHDMGRRQSNYYRQRLEGSHDDQGSSMSWTYLVAGAAMLGIGTYLMYRGFQGDSDGGSSNMGQRGRGMMERGRQRMDDARGKMEEARDRMGEMAKGSRNMPGVEVREQITVNRPVAELFRFWRDVENLPRVMTYLESVTKQGDRKSHWVAKGPAGQSIEWDAEITDARENELVAWRSLEGSEIPNEGSVRFSRSPDGSGTVIDVAMTYHPPGGQAGAAIAKLFNREPAQEIRRDLKNFKERVEGGNLILSSGSQGGSWGS